MDTTEPTTVPYPTATGAPLRVEVHTPYVTYAVGGWEAHLPPWLDGYLAM